MKMKSSNIRGVLLLLLTILLLNNTIVSGQDVSKDARMQWWKDARFGMFIHWGLYAVPAGEWNGEEIGGIGEWIMSRAKIPAVEYRQLANKFKPVKFDAIAWVKVAKDAGMKYITITSKHHDGFAMFNSNASDYNIVDASPYGKDPIKELAAECHKQGIKICFYYSQSRDWNEVGGLGNSWDDFQQKDKFQQYLDEKVKPQLTELLTNYGEVGMIWFDTPMSISYDQASELKALVRKLQPGCIISGRLGGGVETDYISTGDNVVPAGVFPGYWEVPATLNNTWGFKKNDNNWKDPSKVVPMLFDIASKGGNYLLNVGPTAEGVIPEASVKILQEVGNWMKVNDEAIYETNASPYRTEFPWGGITVKGNKLYLGFLSWPINGEVVLDGLKAKVKRIYLLADKQQNDLPFEQNFVPSIVHNRLKINLPPNAPDKYVSVVVVETDDLPEVDDIPAQEADGRLFIAAGYAIPIKDNKPVKIKLLGRGGGIEGWTDTETVLYWQFKVEQPGTYQLNIISNETGSHGSPVWQGGHLIDVECNGQKQQIKITADEKVYNPRGIYWKKIYTHGELVTFDKPGVYSISINPVSFNKSDKGGRFRGFTLSGIQLIKK